MSSANQEKKEKSGRITALLRPYLQTVLRTIASLSCKTGKRSFREVIGEIAPRHKSDRACPSQYLFLRKLSLLVLYVLIMENDFFTC